MKKIKLETMKDYFTKAIVVLLISSSLFAVQTSFAGNGIEIPLSSVSKALPEILAPVSPDESAKLPAADKKFEYGANGGVHAGMGSYNSPGYDVNSNIGFHAGVYFRYYPFKNFYVSPAVYYYFSSYDFKEIGGNRDDDKVTVHSMRIPLLAGYTVINSSKFFLRLQTGPSVGFNLKVKDNDLGVSQDNFSNTLWEWIVDGQMRIAVITVHGGMSFGMNEYIGGSREHTWYAGLGFSL